MQYSLQPYVIEPEPVPPARSSSSPCLSSAGCHGGCCRSPTRRAACSRHRSSARASTQPPSSARLRRPTCARYDAPCTRSAATCCGTFWAAASPRTCCCRRRHAAARARCRARLDRSCAIRGGRLSRRCIGARSPRRARGGRRLRGTAGRWRRYVSREAFISSSTREHSVCLGALQGMLPPLNFG